MKNTKKIIALVVVLALAVLCVFVLAACDKHECESQCETCGKCTNSACTEDACLEKCQGHQDPTPPTPTPSENAIVENVLDTGVSEQFGNYQYKLTINKDLTFEIKNAAGVAADGTWTYENSVLTLYADIYDVEGAVDNSTTVSAVVENGKFVITIDLSQGDSIFSFDASVATQLSAAASIIVGNVEDEGVSTEFGNYQYKLTIYNDLTFEIKNAAGKAADGTWTYADSGLTLNADIYDVEGSVDNSVTITAVVENGKFVVTIDLSQGDSIFSFDTGVAQRLSAAMNANS